MAEEEVGEEVEEEVEEEVVVVIILLLQVAHTMSVSPANTAQFTPSPPPEPVQSTQ